MMRLMVLALVAMLYGPGHGRAEDAVSTADRAAIQQVIGNQIEAFRHDDAQAAFNFAAPHIQAMFGDPAHFMAMVQQGYQPVYRPRSVAFGNVTVHDGEIVQRVELLGADGQMHTALYTMEHETDGNWRIGGCALMTSGSVGA